MNETKTALRNSISTVYRLALLVGLSILFLSCVKGQSVVAASELGKNVSAQYEASKLAQLCTLYNDKVVPRLEESGPNVNWDCEILEKFNSNTTAVSTGLDSYTKELVKTLKVKKTQEDTTEQINELFEILKTDELTRLPQDAESSVSALEAIAQAVDTITNLVFSSLRAGKVAKAVEDASGPINELGEIIQDEIDKLIENELAWDRATSSDSSSRRGLRAKKMQAAIMKDIEKNGCEFSTPPAQLTCENACTLEMKALCNEFTVLQFAIVQSLLKYKAAVEAFQSAHKNLEENASTLKSLVKKAKEDNELRNKIIADAKVIYKAAFELIKEYKK